VSSPREILLRDPHFRLPEACGFTTAWFDLPGLRLHAATAGPPDGPLVLLLHGWPEFWYSWRRQLTDLAAAGYRVVAPDQRGYNLSDKTPPFDIFTLAQDAAALIAACGREHAFVAGHDWGALVAWALAVLHPEKVEKLAIFNVPHPALMVGGLRTAGLRQVLKSYYVYLFQVPRLPEQLMSRDEYAFLRRLLRTTSNRGTFTRNDLDIYAEAWSQPGALSASLGWYRALCPLAFSEKRHQLAQKVAAPTLIQWGERDVALDVGLAVKSLDWCAQGQLIRYPTATHWVHEDLPREINHRLSLFFEGQIPVQ
jgi:pimeloyl-ACP methyl ester carboxylesterase